MLARPQPHAAIDPITMPPKIGISNLSQRMGAWSYAIIRVLLAGVFVWSGVSKLITPEHFALIIESYGLIPDAATMPAALFLSCLEILAGVGLAIDLRWSLGVITVLLVLFMVILGYGLWMGLDVDCGCFGPEDPEAKAYQGLRPALFRDAVMLAGICFLFYWRRRVPMSPLKFTERYNQFFKRR